MLDASLLQEGFNMSVDSSLDNPLLRFMPADIVTSRTTRPEMSLQKLVLFIVDCYQKKVDTDRQCIMVNQPRSRLPEFVVNIGKRYLF